jgi:uncharacterized protein YceH (UPF0502 family)
MNTDSNSSSNSAEISTASAPESPASPPETSAVETAPVSTGGTTPAVPATPAPLKAVERRILGVLMEKARTTPDAYPLSLNGLVTGCNQKSNRHPLLNLSTEAVEDAVTAMRQKQLIAEVHGGGRVPKYRHYGYDYMAVKGVEAGVMTELLLRGEQTAGELRTRASRFDPIADLSTMQQILERLMERGLVVALTPPGRGQLFSHNLYEPAELEKLKESLAGMNVDSPYGDDSPSSSPAATKAGTTKAGSIAQELEELRDEVNQLRVAVTELTSRLAMLEGER